MNLDDTLQLVAKGGPSAIDFGTLRTVAGLLLRERGAQLLCMQHPLGFYLVSLLRQGPVALRLHYWPARHRPPSSAITPYHDHVWTLQSRILIGHIENVELSLKPDPTGEYVVATIEQVNGVDTVVPTGERVAIETTKNLIQSAGQSYSISPKIFHCTNVSLDVAAVTVVRAEVVVPGGPRTLVPVGYSGQAPSRTYLSSSDAQRVLQELDRLLLES